MMFLFNVLFMFMLLIMVMISVAFLTLLERKVLGYIQDRKGPNKLGILGYLQPFSDVIKLLTKEVFLVDKLNYYYYYLMSIMVLILSLLMWILFPFYINLISMSLGVLFLLSVLGVGVYPIILGGWSSNSNYALLGSIRSIAQSISYEVSLFLMMFTLVILIESFSFVILMKYQMMFIFFLSPIYLMFFVSMLMELNRTPFDLTEGESELVSGFNTEYFSSMFAMIFMAEYSSIIFTSFLMTFLFMTSEIMKLKFIMILMFHLLSIIWVRGVLPRIRYDKLMMLCWKSFLSVSLVYLLIIILLKEVIIYFM